MEEFFIKNKKQDFFRIIENSSQSYKFIIGSESLLSIYFIITGSTIFNLEIVITGQNSEVTVGIAVLLNPGNKTEIYSVQDHKKFGSNSNLFVRSLNKTSSYLNFNGLIRIDKKSFNTDAYQRCDSLKLGKNAGIRSQPVLEINNNNVRCTHGVTVSDIKSDEVEYLKSRGISQKDSENLIATGFVNTVFSKASKDCQVALEKALNYYLD